MVLLDEGIVEKDAENQSSSIQNQHLGHGRVQEKKASKPTDLTFSVLASPIIEVLLHKMLCQLYALSTIPLSML